MNAKRRKRKSFGRNRKSLVSVFLVSFVVIILMSTVSISMATLNRKLTEYHVKEAQLEEQIKQEHARAEQISEYAKYVQTDAFIEAVAKEKLGLVYEDEIIFKEKD